MVLKYPTGEVVQSGDRIRYQVAIPSIETRGRTTHALASLNAISSKLSVST